MATVLIEHISTDDKGVARVSGTRSKVSQIVCDVRNGLSPEEIHVAYPHLSLGQIHVALSYYYDHRPEIDAQIEASLRADDAARLNQKYSVSKADLLARAKEKGIRLGGHPGVCAY